MCFAVKSFAKRLVDSVFEQGINSTKSQRFWTKNTVYFSEGREVGIVIYLEADHPTNGWGSVGTLKIRLF